MNQELLGILEGSIITTNKLINLAEADKEDMSRCVSGDILREYKNNSDEIFKIVKNIQNNLIVLQNRQRSGM